MRRGRGKIVLFVILIWVAIVTAIGVMAMKQNEKKEKEEAKKQEKTIEDGTKKLEKEITSGQFYLDGVVYEFPMDLQYWLDNGWHISNNYANKDEFTLKPGMSSNEFELFNEDDAYVRVSVINTGEEDAKIEECMVQSLYMSLTEVNVVFPSGINKSSKPKDVIKAYGTPASEGDESGYVEALYTYENDDAYKCQVELGIHDNDYTNDPLSSVEYSVISFGSIWDTLVASEGIENACAIFLEATMRTCYWGDYEEYLNYAIDSESGAIELYESEVIYFSESLMYYTGISTDYLTEETTARFDQVAIDVLKKVKWEIKDIEVDVFEEGTVTMDIYPTDFFYIIEEDVIAAIEEYNATYSEEAINAMTDEEFAAAEEAYIEAVLKVLEAKVSEAGTLDAVEKEFELDIYGAMISNDDWTVVDDLIMNLSE